MQRDSKITARYENPQIVQYYSQIAQLDSQNARNIVSLHKKGTIKGSIQHRTTIKVPLSASIIMTNFKLGKEVSVGIGRTELNNQIT